MKTFFGEPKALAYLALTELWERFSFYGMAAIVTLYMTDALLLPGHIEHVAGFAAFRVVVESVTGPLSTQSLAVMTFGLYSGLVYLTPIWGGLLADRRIGRRRAVVIGALLLCAGHLALAFDESFLVALALLAAGCGCLKGNISAQVGALYRPEQEVGRTRGFAIFSGWIVVGAFLGPLLCGGVANRFGWHTAFATAGLLMLIALATYLAGMRHLPADPPRKTCSKPRKVLDASDRHVVTILLAIIAITVFQTIAIDQLDSVGLIWIRDRVDLATPFGQIPAAWFNSVGALSQITALPLILALWRWQASRGREPGEFEKIGIGALITTVSMAALAIGSAIDGKAKIIWPLVAYTGYGIGFIYYWPTLLALVSRRAPAQSTAAMMGTAFFSLFLGSVIAGWIGTLYERLGQTAFWLLHVVIAGCGILSVVLVRRPLNARMYGVHSL